MLNLIEDEEGESNYRFEGGNKEIITQVKHEEALKCGEVIIVKSDAEDLDDETGPGLGELIEMTATLEKACITYGTVEYAADLSWLLRQFCIELRHTRGTSLQ